MYDNLLKKLLSNDKVQLLPVDLFPAELKLLVLAPHPDDFDAIAVTMKRFKENGNPITVAVISSGASGVEDSYLNNAGDLSVKALIREREQYESTAFFGLKGNNLSFLRAEEDANGDILENQANQQLISKCIEKSDADIVFMPHWNDTNTGHRISYKLAQKFMSKVDKKYLLFLNKDPKTIKMPIKFYSMFDELEAVWKSKLLKHHASPQERNLHTRGYGFDDRILEFNCKCAAEIAVVKYAEVFDLEVC